jgi:hypothetical protein
MAIFGLPLITFSHFFLTRPCEAYWETWLVMLAREMSMYNVFGLILEPSLGSHHSRRLP